jgi:hypothetical protein
MWTILPNHLVQSLLPFAWILSGEIIISMHYNLCTYQECQYDITDLLILLFWQGSEEMNVVEVSGSKMGVTIEVKDTGCCGWKQWPCFCPCRWMGCM